MYRLQPGGRYIATAQTLRVLVANAWGIPPWRVAGAEGWRDSERYNIEAKTAAPLPPWPDSNKQVSEMLQSLLKDRFQLAVHPEVRQETVYDLVIAKSGSRLKAAGDGESPAFGMEPGRIRFVATPLELFAGNLANVLGRKVSDKTGLTGKFDATVVYAPDDSGPGDDRPSLFTAIEQQLGLRLDSTKGAVEFIVIDRAEKPGSN
jgi:uncharacterized protein (TIGR03435 family)